ncbi:hypothetical protein BHE74_00040677 [Ensete ventricosum]|nr:hypothetical protein BHE74_00040677 [Ensete ventricosum]
MVGSHEPKDWLSGSRGYGPQASCTLELRLMRSAHAQILASTCVYCADNSCGNRLGLTKPRMSGGKNFSVARAENSPSEVEEVHVETIPKRPIGSSAPEQAATARPEKLVKIAVKKHKSHHGEGSSPATARGKEPVDPTKEDSSPTYRQPKSMKDLCSTRVRKDDEGYYAKIKKLKSKGNPEQLAAAKQWAVDLRANYDKVVTELGEATR